MSARDRLLFVDGSAGASGDMILGALVDLGVPMAHLRRILQTLPVDGWTIRARRIERCALAARKVDVRVKGEQPGRGWAALRKIIAGGRLEPRVRERALAIFRRLIEAEAAAHGRPPERVHLHEAGGTDAIIDVVGACVGLEHLGVSRIVVSPLTTGFGSVSCAHGNYPVPGPATMLLVRGVPVRAGGIEAERLTPTGAAILTTVADAWGQLPMMRPLAAGYGAGDHDLGDTPNLLRMVLAEVDEATACEGDPQGQVAVIECTVDDCTPQAIAYTAQQLLDAGALDVFTSAITMKKGRPGHHLTILARRTDTRALSELLLLESTSFGLRYHTENRMELSRKVHNVKTSYGSVRVKSGELGGRELQAWPEYEDCAQLARRRGVPLREVQQAALTAYRAFGSRSKSRTRRPRKKTPK